MVMSFDRLREFGQVPMDPTHPGAPRLLLPLESELLLSTDAWRESDDHVIHFETERIKPDPIDLPDRGRLVALPGNLDLKPDSLFRSLFEEVGWEQNLVAEPELLAEEVERLKEQAERWGRLLSDPDESSSLAPALRSLAGRLRISADVATQSGSVASDAVAAGVGTKSDVEEAVRVAGDLTEGSGAAS